MTRSRLVDHATGHPLAAWVGEQLHAAGGGIYHIHSHAQNATPRADVLKLFPGITPSHLSHIQ